ncbi:MAG: fumarylacetoacetase [Xanthobacteraceae bacterium]
MPPESTDATHDPLLRSWVASANIDGTDFPIQNLPHGVFSTMVAGPRGGVAIGDRILDMKAAVEAGLFSGEVLEVAKAAAEPQLNRLMAMGHAAASALRVRLSALLEDGSADQAKARPCLVPMDQARMHVPAHIGGFTDFCTSVPHVSADRPGRPGRPMHPAFKHLPVAYNGRASSIVIDGAPVERPNGQSAQPAGESYFGSCRDMDYEMEFGAFVGRGNELGQPIHIDAAPDHIFGYVIVNDWSARDIQRFESMLGPFLSKSLRTTISPWIVTESAMAPFRTEAHPRSAEDPKTKPYLTSARHDAEGNLSIRLQTFIRTTKMRAAGEAPFCISNSSFLHCYWSLDQMLVHHASNGCNMQSGDLIASGTVSGPKLEESACLWELTGGSVPVKLPNGEERNWIEDGDEIIMKGRCQAPDRISIGFGTCSGKLLPAVSWPSAPAVFEAAE